MLFFFLLLFFFWEQKHFDKRTFTGHHFTSPFRWRCIKSTHTQTQAQSAQITKQILYLCCSRWPFHVIQIQLLHITILCQWHYIQFMCYQIRIRRRAGETNETKQQKIDLPSKRLTESMFWQMPIRIKTIGWQILWAVHWDI